MALKGSVAAPLPTGPVVAEQFADSFTGLIGGTLANTALVIRFFQKQGPERCRRRQLGNRQLLGRLHRPAMLVLVGLVVVGDQFDFSRTGGRNLTRIAIVVIMIGGVAVSVLFSVPRLRQRARLVVAPQWQAAKDNLAGILLNPRKAAMLFGGNLGSQLLFALAILRRCMRSGSHCRCCRSS